MKIFVSEDIRALVILLSMRYIFENFRHNFYDYSWSCLYIGDYGEDSFVAAIFLVSILVSIISSNFGEAFAAILW